MNIDELLTTNTLYYHCCNCNGIYSDKKWQDKLFTYNNPSGNKGLGEDIAMFDVTSGYCNTCYVSAKQEILIRKQNLQNDKC